jgi:uncharacterized membrane protein
LIRDNRATPTVGDVLCDLARFCHQSTADDRGITKTIPGNLDGVGVHLTNNSSISSNSTMADPFEPTSPPPAPEPIPPNPNPPPEPPPRVENPTTQSTGLPSNIAAALACIPLVGGLIFWFLEKHDNFVRFYAMQSIIFGAAWLLFNIISRVVFDIFGSIPALGAVLVFLWAIIQALVHLGFLVIMVIAMIKAFSGSRWDIPYVGPMARKYVTE